MTCKRILAAFVTVVALGLAFATGALAKSEGNLGWKLNGRALVEGETTNVTGEGATQLLKASELGVPIELECSSASFSSMKLIGTNAPTPGSGEGKIAFGGCQVATADSRCEVAGGDVITKTLVSTDVYLSKAAAEGEELAQGADGIVYKPKEGEVFASFVIGGSRCFTRESTVEVTGTGVIGKFVKASGETTFDEEAQTHEIEATSLHAYFENRRGTTVERSATLKFFGNEATLTGSASMSVKSGSAYSLET
jgi:hypothetical protein